MVVRYDFRYIKDTVLQKDKERKISLTKVFIFLIMAFAFFEFGMFLFRIFG